MLQIHEVQISSSSDAQLRRQVLRGIYFNIAMDSSPISKLGNHQSDSGISALNGAFYS
jgi:hypothetical protein